MSDPTPRSGRSWSACLGLPLLGAVLLALQSSDGLLLLATGSASAGLLLLALPAGAPRLTRAAGVPKGTDLAHRRRRSERVRVRASGGVPVARRRHGSVRGKESALCLPHQSPSRYRMS